MKTPLDIAKQTIHVFKTEVDSVKSAALVSSSKYDEYSKDKTQDPVPPTVPSKLIHSTPAPQSKKNNDVIYSTKKTNDERLSSVTSQDHQYYPESLRHLIPENQQGKLQYKVVKHPFYDELKGKYCSKRSLCELPAFYTQHNMNLIGLLKKKNYYPIINTSVRKI